MIDFSKKHTFVVCAYQESEYLEECIESLLNQTVKSSILISTSTPNEYIKEIARKYDFPLHINNGMASIAYDWNFGYSKAQTPYITIAHQDDVYLPEYAETAVKAMDSEKKPLIFFSDYSEIRGSETVCTNKLLKIKRLLLVPMRIRAFKDSKFIRRMCLAFGDPIGCPAVSFAKDNLPDLVFEHGFRSDVDWQAWERLSKLNGSFLYCKKTLMLHRVHSASETSAVLRENVRAKEDYEMFCKFWPKWIAKILIKFYAKSEDSNWK